MSVLADICSLSPTGDMILGVGEAVGEEGWGEGDSRIPKRTVLQIIARPR